MPETVSYTSDLFTQLSHNHEAPNRSKLVIPIDFFAVILRVPETVSYTSDLFTQLSHNHEAPDRLKLLIPIDFLQIYSECLKQTRIHLATLHTPLTSMKHLIGRSCSFQ